MSGVVQLQSFRFCKLGARVQQLDKPTDDGLIIPTVNEWSRDKHHFLLRYIDAFVTSMSPKRWAGLHYIDLFAGAGIERVKPSLSLEWGSPLIGALVQPSFTRLHLCELDAAKYHALVARVGNYRGHSNDQVLQGDANQRVDEIVREIPHRCLSLAFLDPHGLHLDYRTLRTLAAKRCDLIIFFPDRLDILRNWKAYYWENPESNLDGVLGPKSDWRNVVLNSPASKRVDAFLRLYVAQIAKLGYSEFEWEGIPSGGNRLYWLIFCSKHPVAGELWRGVSQKKPDGQRTFGF